MAMTMARFIFITLVLPIVIQASMRDIKGPYSREGDERFDWVGTTCFGPDAESRAKGYTYDEVGKKFVAIEVPNHTLCHKLEAESLGLDPAFAVSRCDPDKGCIKSAFGVTCKQTFRDFRDKHKIHFKYYCPEGFRCFGLVGKCLPKLPKNRNPLKCTNSFDCGWHPLEERWRFCVAGVCECIGCLETIIA